MIEYLLSHSTLETLLANAILALAIYGFTRLDKKSISDEIKKIDNSLQKETLRIKTKLAILMDDEESVDYYGRIYVVDLQENHATKRELTQYYKKKNRMPKWLGDSEYNN